MQNGRCQFQVDASPLFMLIGKYLRANIKYWYAVGFYDIEGFGHGAKKEKGCSHSQEAFA
jgi:hypothetical protein